MSARGTEAIQEHAAALDGGTLVVVAHGGLLRGSIVQLLGLGVLGNARWAELLPGQPVWRLLAHNLAATPIGSRFGSAPPPRDRLAEPQR